MSANNNEADEEMRCASCGIAANNDIKLKKCTACYLVRYCGVKCQKDHWKEHKKECKRRAAELRECKKRAAELRDELLFKQPETTHFGDCPICCIPLPLDANKSTMMPCCSKMICEGCNYANKKREAEVGHQQSCPFCRHPTPASQVEAQMITMKRVEANDPVALRQAGIRRGMEGDHKGAVEYFTKAATLGDVVAHFQLSWSYGDGEGVEKDEKKELYHLEEAAIGGHPGARCILGGLEWKNGRFERGIRHYIIASKLGDDKSLEVVKQGHQRGFVSKVDFSSTIRAHKAAVDATKSPQRDAADADVDFCDSKTFWAPSRDCDAS